ncbi:uncharacterized protein [Spinacia oleracea]|uniref:Uncharacterized protein isoform X1 n=1 Tax=Spinacia oleracea TaxID=3562 RepID=A0A9R0JDA3_SPIOL|nr:uncharacterized protein LOC110804603 isoform X1 [Spinacia oleracea]
MLRLFLRTFRRRRYPLTSLPRRPFSSSSATSPPPSSSSSLSSNPHTRNPNHSPVHYVNTTSTLSPLSPTTAPPFSRTTTISLSLLGLTAVSSTSYLLYSSSEGGNDDIHRISSAVEAAIQRSAESTRRIVNQMKHTGAAAAVLWQSLQSVLSSANYEVRSGFEFKVAAFLADIAAANAARRTAIVAAGGGRVVDWLLETVAGEVSGTQAEAARALAYLIADPIVRPQVFGRPHSVPYLLRFISSSQPQRSKKNSRNSDSFRGRSMLVAAIMDVVTSTCDSKGNVRFQPCLPANAEMRDIASAIQVIEGGLNLDDPHSEDDDDDGGKGLKGIGIKVLGGTTVLGLSRTSGLVNYDDSDSLPTSKYASKNPVYHKRYDGYLGDASLSSAVVPGLWDDLHSQHVAVPFAAWALANWAMASEVNRFHIQELDQDGNAIMTALAAPERSVKWHGSLVARLLLEDNNVQLGNSVSDWSSCLLSTISQACKTDDIPLALVALSAFLLSVDKSPEAKKVVMEKGLDLMRDTAKQTIQRKDIQEALARALELICTTENRLSLEESLKWSGILLPWACGKFSSEKTRYSATKILSCVLEDFGPSSVPISQGWLAILLNEVLDTKTASIKGVPQPKSDKVKTQIDQSNVQSGILIASQLANSVVNLAGKQLGIATDRGDSFPIADLLSQEPFTVAFKSLYKDRNPKCDAADSAVATLKGIKSLTEICADDLVNQNKIVDSGVLCLLRRFLLRDDYESLAAIEAYDASRAREEPEQASKVLDETKVDANDQSKVRIPPSTHIRRHAARLLTVLSALPKVQMVIVADATWCNWLEECANGKIPGCDDPKIQSYARAALLNVLCHEKQDSDSKQSGGTSTGIVNDSRVRPRYEDMIYLINPESKHWKCPEKPVSGNSSKYSGDDNDINLCSTAEGIENCSNSENPSVDIVFVHGLRGGPFKSWRISEDKSSTKSGLVEKIDQEAGKQGTFWPGEWLSADFPHARLFTLRYKTNLTQWSGASLPLQEVSSMLLEKLVAADIGSRPTVFVTHSMGGLVVKQLLHQAKAENLDNLVNNTVGVVFYSCPHFGSRLADMPWRMGLVLRPAPSIGELRSGSPRLVELNDFMRQLHKKGLLEVLSFCETKVTPIVEGYGGWAFRMEIVPIESAYPGFGEIVVLESTDHINSCKPVSRDDPSYTEILEFLRKVKAQHT